MKTCAPSLENAYELGTAAETKQLYAGWAKSYDRDFALDADYLLPQVTAQGFVAAGGRGPVLDAGAGTGLCGEALRRAGVGPIDAMDISPEMLAQALQKDVYRDVIEADLLMGIPMPRAYYRGIVSSGTFTLGHIGPEGLPALLRVAAPGAQFALSINAGFYRKADFGAAFDRLLRGQWIRDLTLPEVRIYGESCRGEHKNDTAYIALFKKV